MFFHVTLLKSIKSNILNCRLLLVFQEYRKSVELLRAAYYNDTSNENAIGRSNIDLLSDANLVYDILKTVPLQVKANNNGFFTHKNTFLHR